MTDVKITSQELARLVRRHGGVLGAIEFGVRSAEILDPEMASVWQRIEREYTKLRPNLTVAGRMLRRAGG